MNPVAEGERIDAERRPTTVELLLAAFRSRRLGAVLLLGFASGLPLALTGGTLQAWYAVAGVDIVTIGFLALVGQPYVYKFLWAPLMDRFVPPWLGRRRGWIGLLQALLIAAIVTMAFLDPGNFPMLLGFVALMVAFLSASQDIAFDAYRTDVLRPAERGLGAALSVGGYRVAMLVSGGLALVLADVIGWRAAYLTMAAAMLIGLAGTLFGPEPEAPPRAPASLRAAVIEPFQEFLSRRGAILLLLFIVFYKLGDAFAGTLTTVFLIRGAGFSPADIGAIYKTVGLATTLVGLFLGGLWMVRLGLYRALWVFGILQAATNLAFFHLALVGRDYAVMVGAVSLENLAGGMGTAAFVALLMSLCDKRYTATQFALLSALAAVGRVYVGPPAGYLVAAVGWPMFFVLTTLLALPGLFLLWLLRHRIRSQVIGSDA